MMEFQIGDKVAYVHYNEWKLFEQGVPLNDIPSVRYGKVCQKTHQIIGRKVFPNYGVQFGDKTEQMDGVNLIKLEG